VASVANREYELGFELYETLPDGILAVDQQDVVRYADRQAGRLFGQESATLVSAPVDALLPEHLRELSHRWGAIRNSLKLRIDLDQQSKGWRGLVPWAHFKILVRP